VSGHFGDFSLEARLSGPSGSVIWRARAAQGQEVRLRISNPDLLPAEQSVRCFERLTSALTRWGRQALPGLETPVGTVLPDASGRFGLATEWQDGAPALEALSSAPRDRLEGAVRIALEVGDALSALHEAGAVHGAVAAHNAWVGPQGTTLLSFWWSQANLRDHPGPNAPEAISSGRFDALADQWSWGRMLRELLGEGIETPGELETILTRATERDPRARYSSLNQGVEALRRFEKSLRTDDVHRPGPPSALAASGDITDDAMTEDLAGRSAPLRDVSASDDPTVDLGLDDPRGETAPTEDMERLRLTTLEAPAGRTRDEGLETVSLPRPLRPWPWLLWTAALGTAALAFVMM